MAVSLGLAFSIQRCLPCLLALLSMSALSSADTSGSDLSFLWVANGGHDNSTCGTTSDDPCQTIAYGHRKLAWELTAQKNATLYVAAGTYAVPPEGINFEGRPVLIVGEKGAVVDCNGSPKGFVATSGEPSTAVSPLCRALATANQPTSRPAHSLHSHSLLRCRCRASAAPANFQIQCTHQTDPPSTYHPSLHKLTPGHCNRAECGLCRGWWGWWCATVAASLNSRKAAR